MSHPDPQRALKHSAELLRELLEAASERSGEVPQDLWREIAEAAVRLAAAAEILAGDVGEDGGA